jgi:putative membrane protein
MALEKKRWRKRAVIAAVIILPLIYSVFFLSAFWDPYSKLEKLPVAFVNQDQGAVINGKSRNLGNEITEELKSDKNIKWVLTTDAEAKTGIQNREYYAEVTIPADFSGRIASADKSDKNEGIIIYQSEEKRNFLAVQVLNRVMLEFKDKVSQKVTKEIVSEMTTEMKTIPEDLGELNDGLGKISTGSSQLSNGISALKNNQEKLNTGIIELNDGLNAGTLAFNKLAEGSDLFYANWAQFNIGLTTLNASLTQSQSGLSTFAMSSLSFAQGLQQFISGFDQAKADSAQIYQGTTDYAANMQKYADGMGQYLASVKSLTSTDESIADSLTSYVTAHPEALADKNMQSILATYKKSQGSLDQLNTASDTLKSSTATLVSHAQQLQAGSKQLNDGIALIDSKSKELMNGATQLASGANQLGAGLNQLSGGVGQLAEGSAELAAAYPQLNSGIQTAAMDIAAAAQGSSELNASAAKFPDGEQRLLNGSQTLNDGINEAKTAVADSITTANDKTANLAGLDTYAAIPVELNQLSIDPVPNYGTAFSPYFISLSLWIGALLMLIVIYLDPEINFKRRLSKYLPADPRFIGFSLVAAVQAVTLALVLQHGLHLVVKNVFMFYVVCILIALCFTAIMDFLIANLKDVGKFLALFLLILQLTACGGTFPLELVPKFFDNAYPYLPMTYAINALKEVISGVNYSFLYENLCILGGITVVIFAVNLLLSIRATKKQREKSAVDMTVVS